MNLDSILQILISSLTLGGIYAVSAIGIALLWGVMGMLNMAHGTTMAVGAYSTVLAVSALGIPWVLSLPIAIVAGALLGWLLFHFMVRWMLDAATFETNVVVATVGIAIAVKSLLIVLFTANPMRQPFMLEGGFYISKTFVPAQTLVVMIVSLSLMAIVTLVLNRTMMGRAIRATSQNAQAAALMGIPARKVFLHVLMISSAMAAVSGVLVSSVENASPTTGEVALLKVFIICVVAGLGYIPGTILVAFGMALVEVTIQYAIEAKWAYPILVSLALVILVFKPSGLFGVAKVARS